MAPGQPLHFLELPVELQIRVLAQLDDPPSLLSAIVSCKGFYNAYTEGRASIKRGMLLNSTSASSGYCKFLTSALHQFSQISEENSDPAPFVRNYLEFANPVADAAPSRAFDVIPGTEELENPSAPDVHHYIGLWAMKFCEEQLKTNPMAGRPAQMPYNVPTKTELARVARVFYQFWLYCALPPPGRGHSRASRVNQNVASRITDSWIAAMAYVESIGYVDSQFIYRFIIPWMGKLLEGVLLRITRDPENPMHKHTVSFNVDVERMSRSVNEFSQTLMCRLGPIGVWKFLFEYNYPKQFELYCQAPIPRHTSFLYAWNEMDYAWGVSKKYDPVRRICFARVRVVSGDHNWWCTNISRVAKQCVVWDDRRLEEWGFEFPELEVTPNIHFIYSKGDEGMPYISVPIEFKSKETKERDKLLLRARAKEFCG
ncbi:hypothetical protein ABW19_dt0201979 [Dactylella cylindrospora]|nr:hypothetical protein ABW19_dt0201979 [Dactylella cylindrospora]